MLQPFLQQTHDGGLGAAHGPVQQQHAAFGPVAHRRRLDGLHQLHQRDVEAEDRVLAILERVAEELVVSDFLLVLRVLLGPVGDDHVVEPLESVPRDQWILAHDREVVRKRALPMEILVALSVLLLADQADDIEFLRGHALINSLSVILPTKSSALSSRSL